MKPTMEDRKVLRAECLKLLTETRGIFRPSEILRCICHDSRFIMFNCMHVGFQLRQLVRKRELRVVRIQTGFTPPYLRYRAGRYMSVKAYCVPDLTVDERRYFNHFTLESGRPIEVAEWEMLK